MDTEIIIEAKNLSLSFGDISIWKDADFSIKRGEFIGLLGANGAGKSSLFKILLGLIKPTQGSINLFGNIPEQGNDNVGYVPQRRSIDTESRLQALEYVRLGISGTKLGFNLPIQATKERALALEALKAVDAENLAYRSLNKLSGGEMQRIFLAQALVSKPDLLLLDEPLANLDIRRETQLINLVSNIVKTQNITTILIAHDINPLLPVVDRIIYIANGQIASGKPEEIVTSDKLTQLYNSPIEVIRSRSGQIAVLGIEEAVHHDD
jgi:zinc/manganese transport system ATP-binding protein